MSGLRVFGVLAVISVGLSACGGDDAPVVGDATSVATSEAPTVSEDDWKATPVEDEAPTDSIVLVCDIALERVPAVIARTPLSAVSRWQYDLVLARSLPDPTFLRFLDEVPPVSVQEDGKWVDNSDGVQEWAESLQDWCTWNLEDRGVAFKQIVF